MAEHPVRDAQVGPFPQQIHNVAAGESQNKAEQGGNQHPDGQHVQGGVGLGGDHPVIDLHREQNPGQRQQVDEQRRQHHVGVGAQVAHHQPVEPVRAVF